MEEFERLAKPIVDKYIQDRKQNVLEKNQKEGLGLDMAHFSWCVEFKSRNNQKIKK